MTTDPGQRRLLLLEFVIRDPWVYNGRFFPYLAGLAEKHGVPAAWRCLGAAFGHEILEHGLRQHIALDDASLEAVRRELADAPPTHVILSDTLSAAQLGALFGPGPLPHVLAVDERPLSGERARSIDDVVPRVQTPAHGLDVDERRWAAQRSWKVSRTDWFLDWLGEDRATSPDYNRYLVGSARPVYRCRRLNDQVAAFRPALLLAGGIACDHKKELADNPCYQGLELEPGTIQVGCAFCTYFRGPTSDPARDALDVAAEQLRAIAADATHDGRFLGVIDVHDVRLFGRLDEFAALLDDLAFPPCRFVVSPRIDRFLETDLDPVLTRFEHSGHVLAIYRMGGESLVDSTNQRFNKHVTLDQLDRARALWQRLKRDHPRAFVYDETIGYITYTPWTTLHELGWQFEAALERGFRDDDVWVYTPLELQGGSGVTALARHDGLVVEHFEDPAFVYKMFLNNIAAESTTAWRFADPLAGLAFRLAVRYCAAATRDHNPDAVFQGDPLYGTMVASIEALGPHRPTPGAFALAVVRAIEAEPQAPPEHLFEVALAAAEPDASRETRASAPAGGPGSSTAAPDPVEPRWASATRRVARWASGHVPGLRLELRSADERGAWLTLGYRGAFYGIELCENADPAAPCLLRAGRLAVSHAHETPVAAAHLPVVRLVARAFERALDAEAPRPTP